MQASHFPMTGESTISRAVRKALARNGAALIGSVTLIGLLPCGASPPSGGPRRACPPQDLTTSRGPFPPINAFQQGENILAICRVGCDRQVARHTGGLVPGHRPKPAYHGQVALRDVGRSFGPASIAEGYLNDGGVLQVEALWPLGWRHIPGKSVGKSCRRKGQRQ